MPSQERLREDRPLRELSGDESVLEAVTPARFYIAILLRGYVKLRAKSRAEISNNSRRNITITDSEETTDELLDSTLTPRQRKDFCMLFLKLSQMKDTKFSDLITLILDHPKYKLSESLIVDFKGMLRSLLNETLSELMDIFYCFVKLMNDDSVVPHLTRTSVGGLFLRRLNLGFEKLSFADVTNFSHLTRCYFNEGLPTLERLLEESAGSERIDPSLFSFRAGLEPTTLKSLDREHSQVLLNSREEQKKVLESLKEDETSYFVHSYSSNRDRHSTVQFPGEQKWTRMEAEPYIAKQVELLQNVESAADNYDKIEEIVAKIVDANPDLAEVHFLHYMNSLRTNEFCQSMHQLRWCFDRSCNPANNESNNYSSHDLKQPSAEDIDKGFRYAALNLAALHARFSHKEEAVTALKEAIMMAQEANDHICLQHALTWLFKVQPEDRKVLLERCISKSNSLGLSYLTSLGVQGLAQFVALSQGPDGPQAVMDLLSKSDLLNCQHSIIELIMNSYAQKASFWSMYGRTNISFLVSQLLLNLDTSDPVRDGLHVASEATAIALANVAKHLFDHGHQKQVDLVLGFAKSLFQRENSPCGLILRSLMVHIEFQKSLHNTDWPMAHLHIEHVEAFSNSKTEALFMKFQLYLCQGNSVKAAEVCGDLHDCFESLIPLDQVRAYIFQAELACLTSSYANAISPLMSAMKVCQDNKLDFFQGLVTLHTSHVQLQLGMATRALRTIRTCLPIVFSNGSLFECSRARVLLAKCLVAASSKEESGSQSRVSTFKAVDHLKKALEGFLKLRAHHRAKDVLYLMARLYHLLGAVQERNQVSAELKRMEESYPTNSACQLAIML